MPSRDDLHDGAEPRGGIGPLAVRVAGNETTARTINEAIEEGRVTGSGPIGFICECGILGCSTVLELGLEEYEHVREASRQFLVAPGHQDPSDRVVVDVEGRYTIVAKSGEAAEHAAKTDPAPTISASSSSGAADAGCRSSASPSRPTPRAGTERAAGSPASPPSTAPTAIFKPVSRWPSPKR